MVSLASVIGIVIAAVVSSPRGDASAPGPRSVAASPVTPATLPEDANDSRTAARSVEVTVDAAVASPSPGEPGGTPAAPSGAPAYARAKLQLCAQLQVNRNWQELHDCASDLAVLGDQDRSVMSKAEEFRQKAVKETVSEIAAARIKAAIAEGNLREVQKQLKAIASDSVYFPEAGEAFRTAEAKALDDDRRKAQALMAKNDCAGVKRLQAQLAVTGTAAVIGAVAGVAAKCVDRGAPPSSGTAAGPTEGAVPRPPVCEIPNVVDAMSQAANQFSAGFSKSALSLVVKALACKQNERMYRMAVLYACMAHDVAAAKLYYGRVSAQFQPPLVQRCQQENITIP